MSDITDQENHESVSKLADDMVAILTDVARRALIQAGEARLGAEHLRKELEINEAVARKLGWTEIRYSSEIDGFTGLRPDGVKRGNFATDTVPSYCADIKAAWKIVEHMQEKEYTVEVCAHGIGGDKYFECWVLHYCESQFHEDADTAPMAIALAFLKLP